jgi:hypothetical protein
MALVDISDPTNPRLVGRSGLDEYEAGVAIAARYAYGMGSWNGLHIFEIPPANPQPLAELQFGKIQGVGPLVYLSDRNGMEVISIGDPNNPQRVGGNSAVVPDNGIQQIAVSQKGVFVAAAEQGSVILDLFRPLAFEPLPMTASGTFGLRLTGPRGLRVRLQRSTDLLGWQTWQSITLSGGSADIVDADATGTSNRWYRAVGE